MNDDQREFWSSVAQKYDRVADLQIGGRTRLLLRERLEKEQPLGNLVEFGCGTGFFTSVLARKAATVIATDLSPEMLALARERVRAENVTFQPQDCQRTSFSDGSFDTAFLGLVIQTEARTHNPTFPDLITAERLVLCVVAISWSSPKGSLLRLRDPRRRPPQAAPYCIRAVRRTAKRSAQSFSPRPELPPPRESLQTPSIYSYRR
jgi:SAM-dependent methyltransferase